jgi:hypothetical protein
MVGRSKAKLVAVAAALCIAMGAIAACGELPTGPEQTRSEQCLWLDGILHCAPGTG